MAVHRTRRELFRDLGLGAAALPFVLNLPSLGFANQGKRKQRLIVMFSPNGVFPKHFWPDEEGAEFTLKESLKPLEPFQDRMLTLHGLSDDGLSILHTRRDQLSRVEPASVHLGYRLALALLTRIDDLPCDEFR